MERDYGDEFEFKPEFISTHTLTWSVTEISVLDTVVLDISTHTLTWSVTIDV